MSDKVLIGYGMCTGEIGRKEIYCISSGSTTPNARFLGRLNRKILTPSSSWRDSFNRKRLIHQRTSPHQASITEAARRGLEVIYFSDCRPSYCLSGLPARVRSILGSNLHSQRQVHRDNFYAFRTP